MASQAFFRLRFNGAGAPRIDNLAISAVPVPVPEPGTLALLAAGLAGLGAFVRRSGSDA